MWVDFYHDCYRRRRLSGVGYCIPGKRSDSHCVSGPPSGRHAGPWVGGWVTGWVGGWVGGTYADVYCASCVSCVCVFFLFLHQCARVRACLCVYFSVCQRVVTTHRCLSICLCVSVYILVNSSGKKLLRISNMICSITYIIYNIPSLPSFLCQVGVLWTAGGILSLSLNGTLNVFDLASPVPVRTIQAHQVGCVAG